MEALPLEVLQLEAVPLEMRATLRRLVPQELHARGRPSEEARRLDFLSSRVMASIGRLKIDSISVRREHNDACRAEEYGTKQ
jgi:hypothetical protein